MNVKWKALRSWTKRATLSNNKQKLYQLFPSSLPYAYMFIQLDEGECVSTGKTTTVSFPLQSLLPLTEIMELHIKEVSPWIQFFCDLSQALFIFTTTTPQPRAPIRQASPPCLLLASGERLNLDENEIFISTQQLMSILI